MKTILQKVLSKRIHRRRLLKTTVWLLQQVHDAEGDEMDRHREKLEDFDMGIIEENLDYSAIEKAHLESEHTLGWLYSALDDLTFAYWN